MGSKSNKTGVLIRGETPKACMHRGKALWVHNEKIATCEPKWEG